MSDTKEHPILFKPEMVRAILEGRKTETRRVVKFPDGTDEFWYEEGRPWLLGFGGGDYPGVSHGLIQADDAPVPRVCPYGRPGSVLWVRETWGYRGLRHTMSDDFDEVIIEYKADRRKKKIRRPHGDRHGIPSQRQQKDGESRAEYHDYLRSWYKRWRPSIHMPKWACRLRLEVEEVRVEPVQEITAEGALAEGVDPGCCNCGEPALPDGCGCTDPEPLPRDSFIGLWESINADRGFSWWDDPCVWVVRFRKAGGST